MEFISGIANLREIVLRATDGKVIGSLDKEGRPLEWVEAPRQDCLERAEEALDGIIVQLIRLFAHTKATDEAGDNFPEYTKAMDKWLMKCFEGLDIATVVSDYELGIDTLEPYEGE